MLRLVALREAKSASLPCVEAEWSDCGFCFARAAGFLGQRLIALTLLQFVANLIVYFIVGSSLMKGCARCLRADVLPAD